MNLVILNGRLGQNPDLKYTNSGKAVCRFSLATSEKWGGEEKTSWHKVVCWGKTAELANEYLTKGSRIGLQGRIEYSDWETESGEKRYKTEIIVDRLEFMGGGKSTEKAPQGDDRGAVHTSARTGQSKMGFDGRDARSRRPAEDDPFAGDFGTTPDESDMPF